MKAEDRKALAAELLRKTVDAAPVIAEIEDLKIRLRKVADAAGSFTERVEGLGQVEVAAPHAGRFKGSMPTLVPDLFLAMTDDERKALETAGVVVTSQLYTRAFGGSVTVKLAQPAAA